MNTLRSDLTELALRVGGVLNVVQDDDRRDELQQHFERVLNDELFAGSRNREIVAATLGNVIDLTSYSRRAGR